MRVHLAMLACIFILAPSGLWSGPHHSAGWSFLPGKALYEKMFPHRNTLYSYESFVRATSAFPLFAGEGDDIARKRELAAFFAHIAHETTNGWPAAPGGPYVWGLYYIDEQACRDGHCEVYNTGGSSSYKPVPGKSYFGRGPLQLSYAYNYGLAGDDLKLPLLEHPELVSQDGVIAFKTALWFWMREQAPKPSCHKAICGLWVPTPEDQRQHRVPGFGMTIDIINGGVECRNSDKAAKDAREERIGFYKHFADMLQVPTGKDCDCIGMGSYGQ
jgi:chitinase